jgi:hypothetical protein
MKYPPEMNSMAWLTQDGAYHRGLPGGQGETNSKGEYLAKIW